MRKTGDATTAIGNFITNLCCHMREVNRLRKSNNFNYMLGLGDDNLISKKY